MSKTDSSELNLLRIRFKLAYPGYRASARALGHFALKKGITITDFGAHSVRWVKLFKSASA